eukprot:CAMPEP_0204825632 /NCGR_PEP_ID=MMETSP1346-20131115/3494_1 /ASSEMBLY_ACC=CAM_ASM_000771 /TAXON_ID=215587 /ORGANISM="Aplanochytrium stocchinoi, Strain GSBS06" /LENGTH=71 /DNA_ID=CAMNT_0051953341 /DNA_START=471 /DNA_END=686 /DNA_ORIENTATION=+
MSYPITFITSAPSFAFPSASKADEASECMAWPVISIACPPSPCLMTKSSEQTIAAAAPSDVGEHCSFVSGP